MKKLTDVLVEIAKSGVNERCLICTEEDVRKRIPLEEFLREHKGNIKNFEAIMCSHNELMMQWEIRVKENKDVGK